MRDFWNKRYADSAYAYGKIPNQFFKQELLKLNPNNILLPAEGEGRNAVFAAESGWSVTAFDYSDIAKEKALELAIEKNVEINYKVSNFENFPAARNSFACIALIYAHILPRERNLLHKKMVNYLEVGGTLILEGFSKEQINRNTGGPKILDMLYAEDELRSDFQELNIIKIETLEIELSEGEFHDGTASVVRLIAQKKN